MKKLKPKQKKQICDVTKDWSSEIVYEENGSNVPFMVVPLDKEMPKRIFLLEYKETSEMEPAGPDGISVPVHDVKIHQYFDYELLSQFFSKKQLNEFRLAVGLDSIDHAAKKGQEIQDKIQENLTNE